MCDVTKPSGLTRGAICRVTPTFTYCTCCDTPLTPDSLIAVRIGSALPVMILAVDPLGAAIPGFDTIRPLPFVICAYSAAWKAALVMCPEQLPPLESHPWVTPGRI